MAERAALERNLRQLALELHVLRTEEANVLLEQPRVAAVRDHDLELALRVAAQPGDDAELEEQQLNALRKLLAEREVRDLNRVPRQKRRRTIAGEQRL